MSDSKHEERLVDWLLGELPEDQSEAVQRESAQDAELAQDAAELRCLFADLKGLSTETSGRVGVNVRRSVERRLDLRRPTPSVRPHEMLVGSLKIAAVAAMTLGALLIGREYWHVDVKPELVAGVEDTPAVMVREPVAQTVPAVRPDQQEQARVEKTSQEQSSAWLLATNELASLRREFKSRFDKRLRREALRAAGLHGGLEYRIQTLAGEIASKVDTALTNGTATTQDVTMSLRALLAAGSTKRMGDHRKTVVRCSKYLETRVASFEGGELATALAGLADVATLYGGTLAKLVKTHATRMTKGIIEPVMDGERRVRPQLLSWNTPIAQLADAGQVLRIAPAFGVDGDAAARARYQVHEHVSERIEQTRDERPDLLAASLYGFGELVERQAVENRLSLWEAGDLVPDYFVALHHVSWSRFPIAQGFADFQWELRRVAGTSTPEAVTDASALLLCLTVNFAAPGCQKWLDDLVAMR